MLEITEKECTSCSEVKELNKFKKSNNSKDGHVRKCIDCEEKKKRGKKCHVHGVYLTGVVSCMRCLIERRY